MKRKEYQALNALRGLAIVFIFLSHLSYLNLNERSNWLFEYVFREGYVAVIFFFMISGYFSFYSYKNEGAHLFLKKKLIKLYPTFLIALATSICIYIGVSIINGKEFFNIIFLIKLIANLGIVQAYIPIKDIYFSFNGVAWFISALIIAYYLTPRFIKFVKKPRCLISLIVFYIMIVGGTALSIEKDLHWLLYINPFFRLIDFIIGGAIFTYRKKIILEENKFMKLELFAMLIFLTFYAFHRYIPQNLRYDIYYIIPMAFIIFVFSFDKGYISKVLKNKQLQLMGNNSYYFYIFHLIIIQIITKFEFTNKYPYISIVIIFIVCKCFADVYAINYKKFKKKVEKNENKLFKF